MSIFGAVKIIYTAGVAQGTLIEDSALTVRDYLIALGEGDVANHTRWAKIGYSPTMNTTQSDIISQAGVYTFPTGATAMAVIGGANDDGTPAIYAGTSTGGSLTTLIDTGKNFTTVPVVAGDTVIMEKAGASPEFGIVTSLTSTNQLNLAAGFSHGGSGSGRTYHVI